MLSVGIINRAIEECRLSAFRTRMGAVIFKGSRIVSSGHNSLRSSSFIFSKYKRYYNSMHAEQAALVGLDWSKLKGYSILVLKISKTKEMLSMAKPCNLCMDLLSIVGIKNIYYSNSDGEIVKYIE